MKQKPISTGVRMLLVRKTRGFTLIELIVSMAIMTMMGLAFLAQSESTMSRQKHTEFINGVEEILSAMRIARTGAITSRTYGLDEGGSPEVPEGGFGIHLAIDSAQNTITMTEFVDDNDGAGGEVFNGQFDDDDSQISQQIYKTHWITEFQNHFPSGIYDSNELTIIFTAPDATMIINDNDAVNDLTSTEILFRYKNIYRIICLNRISRYVEAISGDSCS